MDYAGSPFEFKSIDAKGYVEGIAAGIGDVDRGGDTILPGAFAKTLAARAGRPLPMLLHHDQRRPVGVWMEFAETAAGLNVKGRFTLAARDAQEAHALAQDGALSGISIGYKAKSPRYDPATGGRSLPEIELHEASLVTVPMHPRAQVASVKAISGARDIEALLRESGVSNRRAKAAASLAWKSINDEPDDAAANAELVALFTESAARLAKL